ncbi:MAG: HAD family phosphatase [Calditrichaeota bacterium]|nr:MAG: HAD family phosphatase [Calditrichota bacterium]MBL1207839.1 HAD family phosphatase [Calditrichota bacterium]NOG47673.1 HAD family phosphatase [Calditrichota bacterium]
MIYKGILFDFDGVVINSMHQHYDAWSRAFAEKGIAFEKEEFFLMEGQGVGTIASALGNKYGLDEQESLELLEIKVRHYYKSVKIEFYDFLLDLLVKLKNKKVPMAVVTGGNRERVEKVITKHLHGFFEAIVTIDDVKNGKPHPEPFISGADKLGFKPQQCIVIENAPLGIRAAKSAGSKVIAVKTTLQNQHLSEADYICDDFIQVSKQIDDLVNKK